MFEVKETLGLYICSHDSIGNVRTIPGPSFSALDEMESSLFAVRYVHACIMSLNRWICYNDEQRRLI